MTTIRRTCPECGGAMTVELLRRDPHDTPVLFLVCPCGYWEAAPPHSGQVRRMVVMLDSPPRC